MRKKLYDAKQEIIDLKTECVNKKATLKKIKDKRPLALLSVDEANLLACLISRIYSFEATLD